eukprot:1148549-Amphidinium_carterae.1
MSRRFFEFDEYATTSNLAIFKPLPKLKLAAALVATHSASILLVHVLCRFASRSKGGGPGWQMATATCWQSLCNDPDCHEYSQASHEL